MLKIAIVGNIASGKTTVEKILIANKLQQEPLDEQILLIPVL